MTDEQTLLLVLFLLFLFECLIWVHRNTVIINSYFYSGWQLRYPSSNFGNKNGGFFLRNPLPPLGVIFLCQPIPFSFSSNKIVSYISQQLTDSGKPKQIEKVFSFNEIKNISIQLNEIYINGELFVKCRTNQLARFFSDFISNVKDISQNSREEYYNKFFQNLLDIDRIKTLYNKYKKKSIYLRLFCNILWIYIFIFSICIIYIFGFILSIFYLLTGYLILHLLTVIIFYFTFRYFYPDSSKEELYSNLLIILLFPPSAIRSIDKISLNLFDRYHPLAVMIAISHDSNFEIFVKKIILDLKFPLGNESLPKDIQNISNWYRNKQIKILKSFFKNNAIDLKNLLTPSISSDVTVKAYCPRCHVEYTSTEGQCSDCNGIDLVPFIKK